MTSLICFLSSVLCPLSSDLCHLSSDFRHLSLSQIQVFHDTRPIFLLEGGVNFASTVEAIVKAGIPVQGHIGLTPQTASALGGFKMQGKDAQAAKSIIDDAKALEDAGAFSLILEAVPAPLGELVAKSVAVPVIGIGAGSQVDGQVLVTHDMVGMFEKFIPSFVKQYANLASQIKEAVATYNEEVKNGSFPSEEQSFNVQIDIQNLLNK